MGKSFVYRGTVYQVVHHEGREQPYSIWKGKDLVYFARDQQDVDKYLKERWDEVRER